MSEIKVNSIKGTGASTAAITVNSSDGTCTANVTNNLSNRNLIINGAFQVAQRGTTASTPGDVFLTTDRIRYDRSGLQENTTQEQADVASGTTPYSLGFRKSLKLTNGNNTADVAQYQTIMTKIEADDMARSGWNYTSTSSYITFSFWVKSSVAQNFYGYLYAPNRSGGGDIYPFETGSLTANTWTKVVKSVPGDSNVTFSAGVGWGLQCLIAPYFGTNYTSSGVSLNTWAGYSSGTRTPDNTTTWQTTNDATFETTGWQLEVGSVATDFEHLSYAKDLALCQRYYYKNTINGIVLFGDYNNSTSNFWATVFLPTVMRANPTATVTNVLAGSISSTSTSVYMLSFQTGAGTTYFGNNTILEASAEI